MYSRFFFTLSIIAVSAGIWANDDNLTITPKGYGSFEIGQVGHGYYRGGSDQFSREIHHIWQQRSIAHVGLTALYNDILEIDLIGEGMMAFSNPQRAEEPTTMQPRNFYYIKSSNAKIKLFDPESFGLTVQVGYFPYKYNKDVKNLGEYLFRTLPYPLVVFADFDYPQVNLLGLRINTTFHEELYSNDLLLHSETVAHPVQNWSISDIFDMHLFNFLTLGGGLSLYHLLSVYQGKNIYGSMDQKFYPENLSPDERAAIDTGIDYNAIKLMGRIAIDCKKIINRFIDIPDGLFGSSDLRLYGEWDLLGTKNYPEDYEKIKDRMIWTLGFNLPGFNIIDIINYEIEYCENGTAFSDANFYTDIPSLRPSSLGVDPNSLDGSLLERSKIRWSLYLKKQLFNNHFSLITQIARDHKKINFYYFAKRYMSFQETLPTAKDWWWTFKTEYTF